MIILYRIFINDKQDEEGRNISMSDGYTSGDPLTLAWSDSEDFTENSPKDVCEVLFERFNIDHPEGYANRSLCVGDVVTLEYGDKALAYAVEREGFKEVEYPGVDDSMANVMAAAVLRMGRKR